MIPPLAPLLARLLALVVAGVGGAGLSACSGPGPGAASASEVLPGRASVEIIGDYGFVLIPTGRLDLTLGAPTDDAVSADHVDDDEDHAPPEGGSWVPVHVEHDPFGEGGVPVGLIGGAPDPAGLALVIDGTTVDLGAPYRVVGEKGTADSGLGTVWVAVDEPPDEIESVELAVTYDGLTQTLDPVTGERQAGAAAALYDEPPVAAEATCASDGFDQDGVRLDLACQVGLPQRTPYLPGPGWADEGRSWLVVGSVISVDRVDVDGTSYTVETIEPSVTLNGSEPLPPDGRFGRVDHDPSRVSGTWAFDASAQGPDEMGIALDLVLEKGDVGDPGPGVREVSVKQTVELPGTQLAAGG